MTRKPARFSGYFTIFVLLSLAGTSHLFAQFQGGGGGRGGGGGGNFGGGNRGGGGGATSSSGRQYYNNSTVGEATITSDPETRRLIVITDEETSEYVNQVITNLDKPKPQVLIKVLFLEVTYNNASDIGVEGTFRKGDGATFGTVSNLFGLTSGLPGGQGPFPIPPGAGLYQILGSDFQATLRAIATAGKTEVLSRPSILTRNSQPASITVGETLPFITDVRYDNNNNAINTIQYQDIGIILRVTPFITSEGFVEMIVSPEISALTDRTVTVSTGVTAPVISKRSADTVVVTPNGQTIIIGGLMENSETTQENKIPFLGDIPGLGLLFKRKIKGHRKTELLIFLTPHIVMDPIQLGSLSDAAGQAARLAPNSVSEAELNRFIESQSTNSVNQSKTEKPKRRRN